MKKIILTLAIIAVSFTYSMANNQKNKQKGFWVVESNINNAELNTFKFYNDENQLLYQETLDMKIDISKKKVQKKLNKLLAELVDQREREANKVLLYMYLA